MKHETNYQWRREDSLRLRKGKINGTGHNSVSSMLSSRNFQQRGGFIAPFTVEIERKTFWAYVFCSLPQSNELTWGTTELIQHFPS
jgi:hypothetical protein